MTSWPVPGPVMKIDNAPRFLPLHYNVELSTRENVLKVETSWKGSNFSVFQAKLDITIFSFLHLNKSVHPM